MLAFSENVTEHGKPAVVALSARIEGHNLLAKAVHVAAKQPRGPLRMAFHRGEQLDRTVTIQWPGWDAHADAFIPADGQTYFAFPLKEDEDE